MNEELRAITKNQRSLDSAVMMSSLMPSEKYSCSGSPLMLVKGSTAMAGRSGSGKAGRDGSWLSSGSGAVAGAASTPSGWVRTAPTKRRPLRAMVRISLWSLPLSPIALRAALMRLVSVESETMRPSQTEAMRSSLLTTRSRFSHQIDEQVEHLRLDGNRLGTAAQLAPVGIKHMIGEEKLHVRASEPRCNAALKE